MRSAIQQAAQALEQGGIVAYPTEAVYGLGCDPNNENALQKLLALKSRPADKGLILIAADFAQLDAYLDIPDIADRARMLATWPGPVTWIVPARAGVSRNLRGEHESLAVRVTAHETAAGLCRVFGGAIVSTSANLSDQPPARSATEIRHYFPDSVDYLLEGPLGGESRPTKIIDLISGRIIRT